MMPFTIELKMENCCSCTSDIENEDYFYISSNGNSYCVNCYLCGYYVDGDDGEDVTFSKYINDNGTARLIANARNVDDKNFGVYALKQFDTELTFSREKPEEMAVSDFLKQLDDNELVLELRPFGIAMFRPSAGNEVGKSVTAAEEKLWQIITFLEELTEYEELSWILDKNRNIVGAAFPGRGFSPQALECGSVLARRVIKRRSADRSISISDEEQKSAPARRKPEWDEKFHEQLREALNKVTPRDMLSFCQNRIKGQGIQLQRAVYMVCQYLDSVLEQNDEPAESWLLTAPSGSGKTEFFRAVRDFFQINGIPVPVVQVDLSRITEEGYKGENASAIPNRILSENRFCDGYAICFLDEADKKCVPSYGSKSSADVNAAVQGNLLTLVEGTVVKGEDPLGNTREFNTSRTMFVFMGAFQRARHKKVEKTEATIGFGGILKSEVASADCMSDEFYSDLTIQDIIDFGMQEELAGRLSRVVNFRRLSREDMLELLHSKAEEMGKRFGAAIHFTSKAETELLELSFGALGIRRPLNMIREAIQNVIADMYFDSEGYQDEKIILIESAVSARPVTEEDTHGRYVVDYSRRNSYQSSGNSLAS